MSLYRNVPNTIEAQINLLGEKCIYSTQDLRDLATIHNPHDIRHLPEESNYDIIGYGGMNVTERIPYQLSDKVQIIEFLWRQNDVDNEIAVRLHFINLGGEFILQNPKQQLY